MLNRLKGISLKPIVADIIGVSNSYIVSFCCAPVIKDLNFNDELTTISNLGCTALTYLATTSVIHSLLHIPEYRSGFRSFKNDMNIFFKGLSVSMSANYAVKGCLYYWGLKNGIISEEFLPSIYPVIDFTSYAGRQVYSAKSGLLMKNKLKKINMEDFLL